MSKTAYQLTHKITIQNNTSDGTGDSEPEDLFTNIWAAKQGNTGRMYYQAAAAQSNNEVTFTIHWTKDRAEQIRPTMLIILDGDTNHPLSITSLPIDPADEHMWLEIHAKDNRQSEG